MRNLITLALVTTVAVACAPIVAPTPDAGQPSDAGTGTGAFDCEYPPKPYGAQVNKKLEPFELTTCDGTPYHFVNDGFCESTVTVVSIAAGWCQPCMLESSQLTERITEPYRDRGVRVIQVLVQDPDYGPPDQAFCEDWVAEYGLTNIELLDPAGALQGYFPSGSLPSTVIVDSHGVIRHREDGVSEGLNTLRAEIEDLLEELE